jgi:hypothetical protein
MLHAPVLPSSFFSFENGCCHDDSRVMPTPPLSLAAAAPGASSGEMRVLYARRAEGARCRSENLSSTFRCRQQSPSTFMAQVLCHVPTPRARSGTNCGRTRRRGLEGDTVVAGVSLASLAACYFPARRASIRRSRCASSEGGSVASANESSPRPIDVHRDTE